MYLWKGNKHLTKIIINIKLNYSLILVHNSVNKRLANDFTEDPFYPKVLFPTRKQCPKCYRVLSNNSSSLANSKIQEPSWVMGEVMSFLSTFYSKSNIKNNQINLNGRSMFKNKLIRQNYLDGTTKNFKVLYKNYIEKFDFYEN